MNKNEINRTLAEWMGWSVYEKRSQMPTAGGAVELPRRVLLDKLKFHYDWNEFMPCWIKFRDMDKETSVRLIDYYYKYKAPIKMAIFNYNTPLEAATLLATAILDLKLLK